jgi:hypothetical protein
MSWIIAGTAVGGAVLGAVQGGQKRKAEQQQNQANAMITAAQSEFNPWTGIKPQQFNAQAPTSTALGGAAEGGLGGAMFAQGLKNSQSANAKTGLDAQKTQLEIDDMKRKMQGSNWLSNYNPDQA